ncbi:MAG: dihydrolipoyl dehydrogenase [Alphaproteobacteria bacterium]|nr:dihydrolipoyl dehydrogenase [Alphaproteobacteria bacterium]MBV9966789.1 dihydrolipoyl dehydrogenase [Alphaproteobacteria bacterium]
MAERYDVVVIGAGPGGYVAAIRAAQLGMKTACIDSRETAGGTCLNIGCIPSKALLQSSEKFAEAKNGLTEHGIKIDGANLDLAAMMARKDKVVTTLTRGVEFLFRKNKVEWIKGSARIAAPGRIGVTANGGASQEIEAKAIVIATGSESIPLPGLAIDEQRIVSSTGALALDRVPERMAVIGGGYIGLELGSVWSRLGSKVTVIEFLDRILPNMDRELGPALQRLLTRSGIAFKLATKVAGGELGNEAVTLQLEPAKGGERETLAADVVLVAIGRRPFANGLALDEIGVARDPAGRITVSENFETNVPGIYAIGDVIRGPMLAHKAEEEGIAIVERLAGQQTEIDYDAIPSVVYTWPEVAAVGKTEEELKAADIEYRTGKFPFTANARARTNAETDGFVKVLADAATDRVLGVHIIGPDAGTMIAEAALAMEFGASAEDIARTCHAHPTLPEALKEAALAVAGRAIHI